MRGSPRGFPRRRGNIGQRGSQGPPRAPRRTSGATRGGGTTPGRLGARWAPWTPFGVPEASLMLFFIMIFLDFLEHFKLGKITSTKRHQQTETGTGCTELVG